MKYITNVKHIARGICKERSGKVYEKFQTLLDKNNISVYRVSKETGIPESTFSMWKKRNSTLDVRSLQKLSQFFGVTIEFFLD